MTKPDGKLVLKQSVSLDGFVGGPDGEVDWLFASSDAESEAWVLDRISRPDIHIMGSRTFADMKAWWPYSSEPFAAPMNAIPKVVFSRSGTLTTTRAIVDAAVVQGPRAREPLSPSVMRSWDEAEVARGPLDEELASLKRRYGLILAHGGARFAQSLAASGAVDEYWLLVHGVALGRGLPLFSALARPMAFEVIERRAFARGNSALVLKPR